MARQDRMTSPERMADLLGGRPIDRVPLFLFAKGFSAVNVGYPVASVVNDPEKSFRAQVWTQEMYGHDEEPRLSYAIYGGWEFGGEVKFPTGEFAQAPSISRYPVQSEADVEKLKLPDVKTAGILPLMMEFCRLQEKAGRPIVPSFESPFTTAGNICGVSTLCRWMLKRPELVHRLLRLATDHVLEMMRYWVETFGAERLRPNEGAPTESNNMISAKHFAEFAFPYVKELHGKLLAMGVKHIASHICGEQNANLPYWAQVPMGDPGIVSFGHEVDLATAVKYFGDTCVIAGNIQPAVIQTGTPEQVYQLCGQALAKAKYAPRGFILMPGCELSPLTPPHNVYMMKKAVTDFGWYEAVPSDV
ncbi:MAG: uroporphyrinogen decarboxylase family protein [Chloroflexota bacterium]|nr:uroporphyrinogen decarboxylase family protein [Chloroflexota bacterium]